MRIAVICGGISEERKISLHSGNALVQSLNERFLIDFFKIDEPKLPEKLLPRTHIVFPALHGRFGEDGEIQELLEEKNIVYAGSDALSSRLCFNKKKTKKRVISYEIRVADDFTLEAGQLPPQPKKLIDRLGQDIVIKPVCQGSSFGLKITHGINALQNTLNELNLKTSWLFEKRILGRELTVGILEGKSLGIVEIIPKNGVYDYEHKYIKGMTKYHFPAKMSHVLEQKIHRAAEIAFAKCGCRDFARVDFILTPEEKLFFLEINTLPGLTTTSLLPKSGLCLGLKFPDLAKCLIMPAIKRFRKMYETHCDPS
jgi:D-alanine-D-alanine ligase